MSLIYVVIRKSFSAPKSCKYCHILKQSWRPHSVLATHDDERAGPVLLIHKAGTRLFAVTL